MTVDFIDYTKLARTRYTDLFKGDEVWDALITSQTEVINSYQQQYLDFVKNVFNIDNSFGKGLDFIGALVKQPRILVDFNQGVHFGFEGSYKSGTFGTVTDPSVGAPFFSKLTTNQVSGKVLSDEEYRRVIKARIIYNNSNCRTNEFLRIVELLSYSTQNSVSWDRHGVINLNIVEDGIGLLSYFISRTWSNDRILPIPLGYRLEQNYIGTE